MTSPTTPTPGSLASAKAAREAAEARIKAAEAEIIAAKEAEAEAAAEELKKLNKQLKAFQAQVAELQEKIAHYSKLSGSAIEEPATKAVVPSVSKAAVPVEPDEDEEEVVTEFPYSLILIVSVVCFTISIWYIFFH